MGCGALLALGLDAGGAALGSTAASNEQKGMNNAINSDIFAMNQYGKQGRGLLNQGMSTFNPQNAMTTIKGGQQQFTNAANQVDSTGFGSANPLNQTNSAVSGARAGLGAQAMGNYAGYSALPQQWNVQNAQLWPQIGLINQEASNRNQLLPSLLQMASQSQAKRASLGSLLGGLGSLAGGMGSLGGAGNGITGATFGTSVGDGWQAGGSTLGDLFGD